MPTVQGTGTDTVVCLFVNLQINVWVRIQWLISSEPTDQGTGTDPAVCLCLNLQIKRLHNECIEQSFKDIEAVLSLPFFHATNAQ